MLSEITTVCDRKIEIRFREGGRTFLEIKILPVCESFCTSFDQSLEGKNIYKNRGKRKE